MTWYYYLESMQIPIAWSCNGQYNDMEETYQKYDF